jgi:hypothetical protein
VFTINEQTESFIASGDLSGCLGRIVDLLSTDFKVGIAGANAGFGVLLNAPKDTEFAAVVVDGITMVRVGGTTTAGQDLTSAASGWATVVTSGAGNRVLGRALTGAASGFLAPVLLKQYYRPNSVGN